MYSQAHVSSHKGASVALRDRWWLKRRRREAEGPVLPTAGGKVDAPGCASKRSPKSTSDCSGISPER